MLAEELLNGHQFTVDGYIIGMDNVIILGMTDTIMHSNKVSYLRFDYPTNILSLSIQERVKDICKRTIKGIELQNSLFNIEFYYNEKSNEIKIIEINPRQVGLFADMYEMIEGQNTYEIMMALSTGQISSFKPLKPRLIYVYEYINISGNSIEEINENFELVKQRLDFKFESINE